ncbi:hypothetical protein MASR1M45_22620 [Candidatus Kapaibacterium sp.]
METLRIDLINPKARVFLNGLAELNLIKIINENQETSFYELLEKFRSVSSVDKSDDEIQAEVELIRKLRYEN